MVIISILNIQTISLLISFTIWCLYETRYDLHKYVWYYWPSIIDTFILKNQKRWKNFHHTFLIEIISPYNFLNFIYSVVLRADFSYCFDLTELNYNISPKECLNFIKKIMRYMNKRSSLLFLFTISRKNIPIHLSSLSLNTKRLFSLSALVNTMNSLYFIIWCIFP